jgi:hypothetical protein
LVLLLSVNSHCAQVILTWASAGFELVGLAAVGWEILGDRKHAQAALAGRKGANLELEFEDVIAFEDEPKQTTWADVQHLNIELRKLELARQQLGKELRERISQVRNETVEALARRDNDLRELIALQAGGSIRLRVAGAICIAIGIGLAVPANLVA